MDNTQKYLFDLQGYLVIEDVLSADDCDLAIEKIKQRDLPPPMYPHPELGCGCDERSWRRFGRRWFIAE